MSGWTLTVHHITPKRIRSASDSSTSDSDNPDNLAAACLACNQAKADATAGVDPQTRSVQPLFNPRPDRWDEHFRWTSGYLRIVGLTPSGRATVARLRMNRDIYRFQRTILRAAMRGGGPAWP
ncbi:MAG: HNH endonuclease [Chloroflexota bacterium]